MTDTVLKEVIMYGLCLESLWQRAIMSLIWKFYFQKPSHRKMLSLCHWDPSETNSLVEKRPHNSAALRMGHVHQGVEIRQQGVSGQQHTSGNIHEGSIPGHRVLPLKEKRRVFRAHFGDLGT